MSEYAPPPPPPPPANQPSQRGGLNLSSRAASDELNSLRAQLKAANERAERAENSISQHAQAIRERDEAIRVLAEEINVFVTWAKKQFDCDRERAQWLERATRANPIASKAIREAEESAKT